MTVYKGSPRQCAGSVSVVGSAGIARPLEHHVRHSPDGFAWGYGGSGPSELARCILLDHFDDGDHGCEGCGGRGWNLGIESDGMLSCSPCGGSGIKLPVSYQDFKFAFVATWPQDEAWTLTSEEIDEWVSAHAGSRP